MSWSVFCLSNYDSSIADNVINEALLGILLPEICFAFVRFAASKAIEPPFSDFRRRFKIRGKDDSHESTWIIAMTIAFFAAQRGRLD